MATIDSGYPKGMSIEWERKFEAGPETPAPRLAGVGGVVGQGEPVESGLDATYFDTRDFRLARLGITLRRRTGGDDEGWHLKLPVAPERREEIHLPLGKKRTSVPGRLRRLVTARSAGEKLVPVAHIATTRLTSALVDADGRVLATLADDRVTAEAAGDSAILDAWREFEVELTEGTDPKLLDDVEKALRKLGAKPASNSSKLSRVLGDRITAAPKRGKKNSAGSVVAEYLAAQAELLWTHDVGVRTGKDDAVHQMRVAARRLRSALGTFRRVLDRDATKEVAAELRWLGRQLSPARDTEVLEKLLLEDVDGQRGELVMGPVKASLTAHFAREEANAREQLVEVLDSPRYLALVRSLDRLLANLPLTGKARQPAKSELRRAVLRADKRLRRAESALAKAPDRGTALHEVRKKAKQARYTGEASAPVLGKKVKAWAKGAKKIQSILGDNHDRVVAADLIRRLGVQEHLLGHNAFTYGLLHHHNTTEAARLDTDFQHAWTTRPPL